MKRLKKAFCVLICLLLVLSVADSYKTTAYASELTNESIRQKEEEISRAKEEKKTLQSGLTNVKELKKELEASKADLANYVAELDADLSDIQEKINELKTLIEEKEGQIVEKTAELEDALEVQQAQYEAMKSRIKFMYEKGDMLYLEFVFVADSFGEMLNKADYIEMLSSYDRKMLDEYVAYAEYVTLCKEDWRRKKAFWTRRRQRLKRRRPLLMS